MLENHREIFTANREAIETVYSSQFMARATSPPIPKSESKTPRKWPNCPPPGANRPKTGQNPVNMEMSPKCWKIIGKCSQPTVNQFAPSTHPNLWQGSASSQFRDLSLKHPVNGPYLCPPRGMHMPQMGQKSEISESTSICFKSIGLRSQPIGNWFKHLIHHDLNQWPTPRQSPDMPHKLPKNGLNALPRL